VKIALAQINPTVGDFCGIAQKILEFTRRAEQGSADLVLFPELCVCGYPPADLLEKPAFVARAGEVVEQLAAATAHSRTAILCGYVTPAHHGTGKRVMNSAALLRNGHIEFVQSKMLLPFYDVFDEQRYFAPAHKQRLFSLGGEHVALTICEDAWNDKSFWENRLYSIDPVEELMRGGGSIILNISASPYWRDKRQARCDMLAAIARRHGKPVILVNQVGGNDSLVFDGSSLALGRNGQVIAQAASFEEDLIFIDTESLTGDMHHTAELEDEAIFRALVLGTRDYVRKCGFTRVIVALSGGIDSALVAAIAVEALGAENVTGIGMPSP
jgi:NAD+ synthase (glutamine-hydrolysing)